MEAIQTHRLTKYYGTTRGIEQVSLTVARGEFFGFIGPNGAGKSTTIRTLLGLIRPTSGSAQVLGLDTGKDRERILARVGYLPSEAVFYPGMRVREVLKLSAALRRKCCKESAEQLCERLQLDPSRRVESLSFGNRKKVAIVCALQHDPELLILDEPTGGLDPLMQAEFFPYPAGAKRSRNHHISVQPHSFGDSAQLHPRRHDPAGTYSRLRPSRGPFPDLRQTNRRARRRASRSAARRTQSAGIRTEPALCVSRRHQCAAARAVQGTHPGSFGL